MPGATAARELDPPPAARRWAAVGLVLVAIVSAVPLLEARQPRGFVASAAGGSAARALVAAVMAVAAAVPVALASRPGESAVRALTLAALAGGMTWWHRIDVDERRTLVPSPYARSGYTVFSVEDDWQRPLYLAVLNGDTARRPGLSPVPHVFRPLPYGFVRAIEFATGDWRFACASYRWFFTYWFLWICYAFVQGFAGGTRAWIAVAVVVLLYPFSVHYYGGQLTDPLSHALFAAALVFIVADRCWLLAAALVLGVLAKETAVILVPAYWACRRAGGWQAAAKTAALGLVCVAAFLAARMPLGWRPGLRSLNATSGLMIGTNLGVGKPLDHGVAPLYQNYLQPLIFVGIWLPLVAANWRRTDPRLHALVAVLTPLLMASSLCFSWLYESRNYVPLIPVLAAAALGPSREGPT